MQYTLIQRGVAEAAHKLPNHLGNCQRLHGHSFLIQIKIVFNADVQFDKVQGMLIDFGLLKKEIERFDHQYLNELFPEKYQPPTVENFAKLLDFNTWALLWNTEFASYTRSVRIKIREGLGNHWFIMKSTLDESI